MNCSEFNRLLDNYENLSSNELDEMNNHAQNCESCKNELEFYKSIMLTAASLPVPEPPVDLIEKVNSRIDNLPKYKSGFDKVINNLRCNTARYASLAACVAVGVIVGLNSKGISDMLNPQRDYDQVIPIVDVADAGNASVDNDDVPVVDDTPVLPDTETAAAEKKTAPAIVDTEKKAASAPAAADKAPAPKSVGQIKPDTAPEADTLPADYSLAALALPEIAPESRRIISEPVAVTQAPANTKTSRYTIARENYHIPTPTNEVSVTVTEAPNEAVQINPSERYQIAMGNYEIPEEEKKAIRNKLIVSKANIDEITSCMNESGIKGTVDGCEASVSAFSRFLAMLDERGIYYNYAQASSEGAMVNFILLIN